MRCCIATGVAGLSIEDFTGDDANPLYDFDLALARVKAARAAIDKAGGDVVFTARTEGFIHGRPDLDETIRRLKAFADAGADCLYSPGIKTREQIEATVKAVGGKAINFLNSGAFGFTVGDLAGMGVRRISVGGTLARVAMDAFIKIGTADRAGGQVRQLRRGDFQSRAEQVLQRRPQEPAMTGSDAQPLGPAVDPTPAPLPGAVTLKGRFGTVERLDAARHGADLWQAVRGHDAIWTYLPAGPFADAAAFAAWLAACERNTERIFYAILDNNGRALGISALMEIRPAMRVIEVGHIVYSPALQRTPLGTEAQYLLARYVFETLGYRRYEWKCNALNAPSRRAARALRLQLRGHFPPAHDRQGQEPRHRLVLHARQRMAGATRRRSSAG